MRRETFRFRLAESRRSKPSPEAAASTSESAEQVKRNCVNNLNRVTRTGGVGTIFASRAAGKRMARWAQR
jgi:hypothetical protein